MSHNAVETPPTGGWRVISLAWQALLAATMIIMVVAVGLGIGSRYLFNRPFFWTEELSRFGLIWMTFLGSAELFRRKVGHIAVTALLDAAPTWLRRPARSLGAVLIIALLLAMIIGGITFANPQRPAVSAALGLPMWILYMVVPVSGMLGLIFYVQSLVRSLAKLRKP